MSKPLIIQFTSTRLINAFIWASLIGILLPLITIHVREAFIERNKKKHKKENKLHASFLTLITLFVCTLIFYIIIWKLFGYGGGMLTAGEPTSLFQKICPTLNTCK